MSTIRRLALYLVKAPIHGWRLISPSFGPRCRYLPSCSEYALIALERHGLIYGGWLAALRILRCHPIRWLGGGSGFDPVPESRHKGGA
jgi:putative membrane protein insertion efficiency factor